MALNRLSDLNTGQVQRPAFWGWMSRWIQVALFLLKVELIVKLLLPQAGLLTVGGWLIRTCTAFDFFKSRSLRRFCREE